VPAIGDKGGSGDNNPVDIVLVGDGDTPMAPPIPLAPPPPTFTVTPAPPPAPAPAPAGAVSGVPLDGDGNVKMLTPAGITNFFV